MILINNNKIKLQDSKKRPYRFWGIIIACLVFPLSFGFGQEAKIQGDTTICSGGTVSINLTLTGVSPWDVTIELIGSGGTFNYIIGGIVNSDTVLNFDKNGVFSIISANDNNGTIDFSPDSTVTANLYAPLTEAILSGSTKYICEENNHNVPITLRGNGPWNITYSYNGGEPIEILANSSPYYLNISEKGVYSLVSVTDQYCAGTAVGSFTLNHYEKSSALLVGGEQICEGAKTPLSVIFDGSPPYNMKYELNDVQEDTIEGINQSPFSFNVSKPGVYEIYEFTDYNGCFGIVSGSAIVTNHPPVELEFTNLNTTYAKNSLPFVLEGNPSGGEFNGDGVVSGTFYPEVAADYGELPYEIIYTYTNPSTGCVYKDTAIVNVIDSRAEIILPEGDDSKYCSNDAPFVITGANLSNEIGEFSISGGTGLVDNGDNTATIYPQILSDGNFIIEYSYDDGGSPDRIERLISIEYVDPIFFNLAPSEVEVCSNDSRFELTGNKLDGFFSGDGIEVDSSGTTKYYFNPQIGEIDTNFVVYNYETPSGCKIDTTEIIIVNSIPKIDFTISDSCINESSPVPIQFVNLTESEDEIESWQWNFNDAGSGQNTSTEMNPTHTYETLNSYFVNLTAETNKDCVNSGEKKINFRGTPISRFEFSSECFKPGAEILFKQRSISNDEIDTCEWIFKSSTGSDFKGGDSVFYKFNFLDEHSVKLITKTVNACVDTFEEIIQLKPTINISDGPYFQNFETQNSFWENEFIRALKNNSWVFGSTEESFTGVENNKAWYTKLEYLGEESSWVKSPCFDFSDVEKPYVKFNIWRDFEAITDGANLQYSYDNGNTWKLVGTIDDGLNWYNSFDISGTPGGQLLGWSNNLKDNNWVEVKHRLDSVAGTANVQFRLAYGTSGTNRYNYGVAFDDVWFRERNHVILMEHFTNNTDALSQSKDSLVNKLRNLNIKDLIDIQYHTDFPGIDSLNLASSIEVNARLLSYGLSDVPLSVVDGIHAYDYVNSSLTNKDLIIKSLKESEFLINLNTTKTNNNLNIDYTITSLSSQIGKELFLRIVILEDSLSQVVNGVKKVYTNTFRKFLPDAGGIELPSDWNKDGKFKDSYSWEIEKVKDTSNMKVVLFIQDENSKEILQAAVDKKLNPVSAPRFNKTENRIKVYPNPFNNRIWFDRNSIKGEIKVDILSLSGSILSSKILQGNESNMSVNESIPSGLYLLRVIDLNGGYTETIRIIKH